MRVDIQPQWKKLADWYWEQAGGHAGVGMSIWDMIERDYGAKKVYHGTLGGKYGMKKQNQMLVKFSDEKMYMLFLLRWS
jgi:hypothetical protein